MAGTRKSTEKDRFETIANGDLPSGRKDKHFNLLKRVLSELEDLPDGRALKIPLADFPGSAPDLRSAIHRAAGKKNIDIATSSDDDFFYVWKPNSKH